MTLNTAITNLRNRIEASKKAPKYNERTHVDAPVHELEAMLKERDDLISALKLCLAEVEKAADMRNEGCSNASILRAINKADTVLAKVEKP